MPLERLSSQKFVQGHVEPLDRQVAIHAQRDELSNEAVKIRVLFDQRPIEPGNLIVLAEGIVVSALGAPHFVSHQQHRRARRE